MPWSLLIKAVKFVFTGVVDSIKQNRAIKAQQVASAHSLQLATTQARIERLRDSEHAVGVWDQIALKQSGFKGDFMLIVITAPLILCFIPGAAPYVAEGFAALNASVPAWWITAFAAAVAVSFGIKSFATVKAKQ